MCNNYHFSEGGKEKSMKRLELLFNMVNIKRNSILKFHLTLDVCEGSVGGFHQIDSFEGRACRVTLEKTVASNDCRNC